MDEPFGRWFYEWWSGLGRGWRYGAALIILLAAALTWHFLPDSWLLWAPFAIAGLVLLAFAGVD